MSELNKENKSSCLLIAHSFSPPHAYTLSEAQILRGNGFRVTIVALGSSRLPREEKVDGMRLLRARNDGPYYSPFHTILSPFALFSVFTKALKDKAGVYHCYDFAMLPIALSLKLLRKRVIVDIQDDNPSNYSYVMKRNLHLGPIATLAEKFLRFIESITVRRADYVITLTESLRRDRLKYTNRIKTIYYCPSSVFNPANSDDGLMRKFQDFNVIIYSGTISPEKGLYEILDAFDIVREQVPDALLMMVGASSPESKEGKIEKLLSSKPGVMVTGWLSYDEMPKYTCLGRVGLAFVNPKNYSYRISIPFKLLEQMACGLPVVSFKGFPEIERIVRSADAGILVEANDPSQIAEAVIQLLKDEQKRTTMGRNASSYIQKHHNLSILEKELLEVYDSVLGGWVDSD